jgi:hypothetical protein
MDILQWSINRCHAYDQDKKFFKIITFSFIIINDTCRNYEITRVFKLSKNSTIYTTTKTTQHVTVAHFSELTTKEK